MKILLDVLRQELRSAIALILSLLLGYLALFQNIVASSLAQMMQGAAEWAKAAMLLLALSLFLGGIIFWQRPKKYRYTWLPDPGCYVHRSNKFAVCQPCLDIRHLESRLSIDLTKGFHCRNCGQDYAPLSSLLLMRLASYEKSP